MSKQLIEDLKDELAKGNVLAIVGAGVSVAATNGATVASWEGLLKDGLQRCVGLGRQSKEWADFCLGLMKTGGTEDLIMVAERITGELGGREGDEYAKWLKQSVGSLQIEDEALLKAIRNLDCPIVTTNYDSLLEDVTGLPDFTWKEPHKINEFICDERQAVLHIHGHFDKPESVVLGVRSYEDILDDESVQSSLRTLLSTRTLLFIGVGVDGGLSDPNFGKLQEWIGKVHLMHRHYVLVRNDEVEAVRARLPLERHIFPLGYGPDHRDLTDFLKKLVPAPVIPHATGALGTQQDDKPKTDSYTRVAKFIRAHIFETPTFWTSDPVLESPRTEIYHPLRLDSRGQKIEPDEAAQRFHHAVIVGEIGSGKSSLMAHLADKMVKSEGRLSHLPLPVNLPDLRKIEVGSNHPLDALLRPLFWAQYEEIQKDIHDCWAEGRLWLLIDNIDRLDEEDQKQITLLIVGLHSINPGKQNRIWITARPQTVKRFSNTPEAFEQLRLCAPTIPEVWQYLRSWRSELGKSWKKLYDLWTSPSLYLPRRDLSILNVAIRCYKNRQQTLPSDYLKALLPDWLQSAENIERVNYRLRDILVELWKDDKQIWQVWKGQIPQHLFDEHWSFEDNTGLRSTVLNSVFDVNENEACISVPKFMLSYWLSEAFFRTRQQNEERKPEMNQRLATLMTTDPDQALLCLNRLPSDKEWGDAFEVCLLGCMELSTEEGLIEGLSFLWKAFPQVLKRAPTLEEDTVALITESSEVEVWGAQQVAVDELARNNMEIPESLSDVLPQSLKTRYQKIKELKLSEESGKELGLSSNSTTDEWELLLDILEQYPSDYHVRQIVDICFDYDISINDKIIKRILNSFDSFREEIDPKASYYRHGSTWCEDMRKQPEERYERNRGRTTHLLQWLAGQKDFSSLENAEKIYGIAARYADTGLKLAAIHLLPDQHSDDVISWLRKIREYEKNAAWELQREILQKLIDFKDIDTLENIIQNNATDLGGDGNRTQAFVAAALVRIYLEENNESLAPLLHQFTDFQWLKELAHSSLLTSISLLVREKLAEAFVKSKDSLTISEAKVICSLSENDNILDQVERKLLFESARKQLRATFRRPL